MYYVKLWSYMYFVEFFLHTILLCEFCKWVGFFSPLPFSVSVSSKCSLTAGDNGNGIATIRSLVKFDREEQKFYYLPIVMTDMRGHPDQPTLGRTATSTLTIEIGDENDNPHSPAHQNIHVYNYKGNRMLQLLTIRTVTELVWGEIALSQDSKAIERKSFFVKGDHKFGISQITHSVTVLLMILICYPEDKFI